ncbi:MAG: hypothetical protein R2726_10155 [Acidimicrobiales bacterium]
MDISGHGIDIALPSGWEGRISRQPDPVGPIVQGGRTISSVNMANFPVTHLANFGLPPDRGDFGSGAVDVMGPANVFIALNEYGPECVATPLYPVVDAVPHTLNPADFSPNQLQRAIKGQAGVQRFFTVDNRAFVLFVVLGGADNARTLVPQANGVLAAVTITPR